MGTREAIREEFMRIYARERLDRMTVKGLCAAVPVARTTFYSHYRNVDDVLREVEDDLLAGLRDVTRRVSGGDVPHMDFDAFLDEVFGFIRGRWSDFRVLVVEQPDARFIAGWKEAMKANLACRYPQVRMHQGWDLIAEMYASAIIGAYTWWMVHPQATGIEDVKVQMERAINAVVASL